MNKSKLKKNSKNFNKKMKLKSKLKIQISQVKKVNRNLNKLIRKVNKTIKIFNKNKTNQQHLINNKQYKHKIMIIKIKTIMNLSKQ